VTIPHSSLTKVEVKAKDFLHDWLTNRGKDSKSARQAEASLEKWIRLRSMCVFVRVPVPAVRFLLLALSSL
jgi:hypothetical protein